MIGSHGNQKPSRLRNAAAVRSALPGMGRVVAPLRSGSRREADPGQHRPHHERAENGPGVLPLCREAAAVGKGDAAGSRLPIVALCRVQVPAGPVGSGQSRTGIGVTMARAPRLRDCQCREQGPSQSNHRDLSKAILNQSGPCDASVTSTKPSAITAPDQRNHRLSVRATPYKVSAQRPPAIWRMRGCARRLDVTVGAGIQGWDDRAS